MSTNTRGQTGWVGWIVFAGFMLIMVGAFHVIEGLVALFRDEVFLVGPQALVVNVDYTAWGWVYVIGGILAILNWCWPPCRQMWARILAVGVAFASAVLNMAFLPAYPVWSAIVIALDGAGDLGGHRARVGGAECLSATSAHPEPRPSRLRARHRPGWSFRGRMAPDEAYELLHSALMRRRRRANAQPRVVRHDLDGAAGGEADRRQPPQERHRPHEEYPAASLVEEACAHMLLALLQRARPGRGRRRGHHRLVRGDHARAARPQARLAQPPPGRPACPPTSPTSPSAPRRTWWASSPTTSTSRYARSR